MKGKLIAELASQKFADEMAKKFSDIEAVLVVPSCGNAKVARKKAHEAWKELVNKYGASPAA